MTTTPRAVSKRHSIDLYPLPYCYRAQCRCGWTGWPAGHLDPATAVGEHRTHRAHVAAETAATEPANRNPRPNRPYSSSVRLRGQTGTIPATERIQR